MRLIFDVNEMKKLMLEFELDAEKMPLGKLSKNQIQKAYAVLSELQELIDKGSESKLIEATNRFYTLIPHSFGVDEVQILRDKDIIQVCFFFHFFASKIMKKNCRKKWKCWTV